MRLEVPFEFPGSLCFFRFNKDGPNASEAKQRVELLLNRIIVAECGPCNAAVLQ